MYAGQSWDVVKVMNKQKATHLSSLIDALDSRLNSDEPANRSLVSLLNSLAAHLEMHFELEKPEKYFAAAAAHNGRINSEAKRLESEREALLCDVDDMIAMARLAFIHKQPIEPLVNRYRAFEDRFIEHEAAEKKLVQEILSADPSLAE
jgi:transcriptional antiterminator Rof (Rho-off)